MLSSFAGVLIFMGVGLFFVAIAIFFSGLIRPRGEYSPGKYISYECGEIPDGSAWIQFNIRFYVVALIFLIFDVEVILLLPWAVVFKNLGAFAFVEGLVFVGILAVALAYVWSKGDLAWVKPGDAEEMKR
jgi:NADH:ubiquinone oxidoreductase subunit 3 (subunit A)